MRLPTRQDGNVARSIQITALLKIKVPQSVSPLNAFPLTFRV